MNKQYDFLIIGSGLFGSTFAKFATDNNKRCLIIEKRLHCGGNLYCEDIEGINVHKYGAHIFHTSDKDIWEFVNKIVPFKRYTNSPIAMAPDGKIYNLPFNMNTFYQMWGVKTPEEAIAILKEQKTEAIEKMKKEGIKEPRNLEEQALLHVGKDIFITLIKGYSEKQWGRPCSELPPFLIRRLPLRLTFDNNYFNDSYQGIPMGGYNKLIKGLLKGSEVLLNTDFFSNRKYWESLAKKIVFTGKIDEFYNYRFGKLEYRTLIFETEIHDKPNWQGNAVVNYTGVDIPFTRIIEYKHFEKFGNEVYENNKTIISKEISTECKEGMDPFYPINNKNNQKIYMKYKELADKETDIIFGGRLAEYKYYDMTDIIKRVKEIYSKIKDF